MAFREPGKRLRVSTFKLNALLNVTQAINANLPTEKILERYEKILKEDLNIGKILIYKFEEKWETILNSDVDESIYSRINVEKDLMQYSEITFVTASPSPVLSSFDIILPVINNNTALAFVLIGDIDEEGEGVSPTIKHLHFIQTLSNIIIVAIENIRLFNESLRQEALKKELELASRMQTMLIPDNDTLPENEYVRVSAFYHPHYDIGGDYYDCIQLSKDEIGFCIADVSGKGISAAILMSNFQANLRALFTHEISLPALVEKLNERVLISAKGEKFITLFAAKYNYKYKELNYINAGHNPPLLYEENKNKLSHLRSGCVGIGMLDEIPSIKKGTIYVKEPTKLLCYTDGLVELFDDKEVEYGTEIIEKLISDNKTIKENIDSIIENHGINSGNSAIFDDITMLGVDFHFK